ncbi:integrin alpha-5-like [Portunus trituberculatus]|uniref:integrin alpha-5-like n=1 Tax=Portunus trituberculatus TaxID=210409 RepID=UPI001E1CCBA4|nr:integrin alpha-5-like [Portunus trituberculatus]
MAWCHLTRCKTRVQVVYVVELLVIGWLVTLPVEANNLQVENPLVLQPNSNQKIHFGFSLSRYTDNNQSWLLVGAPKSNVSRPDMKHSGVLYRCLLSGSNKGGVCEEMVIDLSSHTLPSWAASKYVDHGLGFSLASDGEAIMVCAPQWYVEREKYNERNYLPVGVCFAAKSPSYEFKGFSPTFQGQTVKSMSYLNTGSCQFGISAAHLKYQNTFALGAPGCWTWRGDTWEVGLDPDPEKYDLKYMGSGLPNSVYLGYSVASFKFAGQNAILSSIPRSKDDTISTEGEMLGPAILVLTQNPDDNKLKVSYRISPSKASNITFAFFGYSLATLDMNGDGLEDLAVGAPFYNSEGGPYDQGAIFIYMQIGPEYDVYKMEEEDNAPQRKGSKLFSRFGSCLAAIGDLDGDGYEDLAVGAPFEEVGSGEDAATGVVYIYMGSEEGLGKDDTRQIIKATPKHFGFGSSIAQQVPSIEGQGYDLAIGAYDSDTVLVFKSKEVVNVTWSMAFIGKIDLSKNECICGQFGQLCPCIGLEVCLEYYKKIVKYEDNIKLGFNITLSTVYDELFFLNEKTEFQEKFEVQEGENNCKTLEVLAKCPILSHSHTQSSCILTPRIHIIKGLLCTLHFTTLTISSITLTVSHPPISSSLFAPPSITTRSLGSIWWREFITASRMPWIFAPAPPLASSCNFTSLLASPKLLSSSTLNSSPPLPLATTESVTALLLYISYETDLIVHWPHTIDGKYFLYLMENFSIGEMDHKCFYPSGLVDPFNLKVDAQKQGSQTHAEKANVLVGIGDKRTEYKEVTCSIGEITAGEEIIVSLRSRLVLRTLKELELGTAVKNASSFMDLQITKMPLSHDLPPPSSSTIDTKISYQNENPDATVPVWVYIVSVLGGLLLLGIIVVILWKCGFFKRNRTQTPDNVAKSEEEHLTEEGKTEQDMAPEEEEQEHIKTPVSPMLKETESAAADFEFLRA